MGFLTAQTPRGVPFINCQIILRYSGILVPAEQIRTENSATADYCLEMCEDLARIAAMVHQRPSRVVYGASPNSLPDPRAATARHIAPVEPCQLSVLPHEDIGGQVSCLFFYSVNGSMIAIYLPNGILS